MEAETTLNTRLLGFSVSLWRQVVSPGITGREGFGVGSLKKRGLISLDSVDSGFKAASGLRFTGCVVLNRTEVLNKTHLKCVE